MSLLSTDLRPNAGRHAKPGHQFPSAGSLILASAIIVLLVGVVPYVMRVSWLSPGDLRVLPLQVLLVGSSCLIGALIGRGSSRYNLYTAALFVYLFGALAPLAQIDQRRFYLAGSYSSQQIAGAALVTMIGALSWLMGYFLATTRKKSISPADVRRSALSRLGILGLAVLAAAALVFGIATAIGGRGNVVGASNLLAADSAVRVLVRGVVIALTAIPTIGLLSRRKHLKPRDRRLMWFLTIALVVVVNPVTNPRFIFGAFVIAMLISFISGRGRTSSRAVLLALLGGLLVVFPIVDSFRFEFGEIESVRFDRELLLHGDYDSFQQTMNVMVYVERDGFTSGRQLAGSALVGVPRSLWPGKPTPTGPLVGEAAGYTFTNLSSPLWSEGFIDLGYVGAVVLCAGFGTVSAFADRRFIAAPRSLGGILAPLLAGYQIIILRGSLMGVSSVLIISAVVGLLLAASTPRPGSSP